MFTVVVGSIKEFRSSARLHICMQISPYNIAPSL